MNSKTKKITMIAMLCAIAYVVVALLRIPVVLFLDYEAKDVIITIGGFIFGPLTAFIISVIVSFIEMLTISDTQIIGCIMNILSTCSFACTAAWIYKKKHSLSGAILGLIFGIFAMVIVMLLWNYLITPIYMGYPREEVAKLLLPAFLPFNLVKSAINMALILLIYKPIVSALRKASLIEISSVDSQQVAKSKKIGLIIISIILLATCIFFILVLRGIV